MLILKKATMMLKTFLLCFLLIFFGGFLIFFKEILLDKLAFHIVDHSGVDVLQKLQMAQVLYLEQDTTPATQSMSSESCHFFNCFNIYRCVDHTGHQKKILVHIPTPKRFVKRTEEGVEEVFPLTLEYVEILETIATSSFYTPDPDKACIFVPALDLLNELRFKDSSLTLQALEQASCHWSELSLGENHLLFSFYPGSEHSVHGRAMMAAAGMSTLSYRTGFDVSLPTYSVLQDNKIASREKLIPKTRNWFLLSPQVTLAPEIKDAVSALYETHPEVVLHFSSCQNLATDKKCKVENKNDDQDHLVSYTEALSDSSFCLILKNGQILSNPSLMEALHYGCIPVVAIDSLVLPFSEVIDWKRFSIRIHESDLPDIVSILSKVSERRTAEMRLQGSVIYEKYFSTIKKMTMTTLQILNDRIFSHHAKNYLDWNVFPNLKSPLFLQQMSPASQGFTAVILTYDRWDSLLSVISRVSEAPSLNAIVVVWNNQDKSPPPLTDWPKLPKPIRIITTRANKLTNRFYPYDEIETEAVLSIDDDIVMLTADELEFGFQVWREFPDRLVGFPSRTHVWNNVTARWRYESEWTSEVSLVLTGAAFYHKYWHNIFTQDPSPEAKAIRNWVDEHMNCEDLAMNFMISNMTGKAPIKVTPRKKFKCSTPQCTNSDMLSGVQSHLVERSDCINMLTEKYGYMPLKPVEFRADPVLFKDNLPEKLKKFANIGSL